jgi:hypothetical protein
MFLRGSQPLIASQWNITVKFNVKVGIDLFDQLPLSSRNVLYLSHFRTFFLPLGSDHSLASGGQGGVHSIFTIQVVYIFLFILVIQLGDDHNFFVLDERIIVR